MHGYYIKLHSILLKTAAFSIFSLKRQQYILSYTKLWAWKHRKWR